jgi:hypothetical protein
MTGGWNIGGCITGACITGGWTPGGCIPGITMGCPAAACGGGGGADPAGGMDERCIIWVYSLGPC